MTRKKTLFDYVNIIDVEATCWETKPPGGVHSEIIEIGLCTVLFRDCQDSGVLTPLVGNAYSSIVRPTTSTVSKFCTELTSLTLEQILRGMSFSEACKWLRTFSAKRRVWASWGDYDRTIFEKQCSREGIEYPFGKTHINVKSLFSLHHRLDKGLPLGEALKYIGLEFKGTPHRGVDDALNIAKIFSHLFTVHEM